MLPEVASPDRKVSEIRIEEQTHTCTISMTALFLLTALYVVKHAPSLFCIRFRSEKSYCGPQLLFSSSWYVAKFRFTASKVRKALIPSIGCVSF